MSTTPVDGCAYCATTGGVMGCPHHGPTAKWPANEERSRLLALIGRLTEGEPWCIDDFHDDGGELACHWCGAEMPYSIHAGFKDTPPKPHSVECPWVEARALFEVAL